MSKGSSDFAYLEAQAAPPTARGETYRITPNTLDELYTMLTALMKENPEMKDYKVCHVEFGGIMKTRMIETRPQEKIIIFSSD